MSKLQYILGENVIIYMCVSGLSEGVGFQTVHISPPHRKPELVRWHAQVTCCCGDRKALEPKVNTLTHTI